MCTIRVDALNVYVNWSHSTVDSKMRLIVEHRYDGTILKMHKEQNALAFVGSQSKAD